VGRSWRPGRSAARRRTLRLGPGAWHRGGCGPVIGCRNDWVVIARFWWHSIPETVRSSDQARISFLVGQVVLAVLVQVSIAIIVAARVRWLGVLHSLFAAYVAGCVMAVGILGLNLAFGGTIDPSFAWTTFALVLNGGALLSLPLSGGRVRHGVMGTSPPPEIALRAE
jgi:hypothetical protein